MFSVFHQLVSLALQWSMGSVCRVDVAMLSILDVCGVPV